MYQCNKSKQCNHTGCDNSHLNHKHCNHTGCDNSHLNHKHCNHADINMPIAMAYVPYQTFKNIYTLQDGCFCGGTIFKDLEKPFLGRRI